jgi:hypothetical protein
MLQITRLNTIFGVHATEDEALQAALATDSHPAPSDSPVPAPV